MRVILAFIIFLTLSPRSRAQQNPFNEAGDFDYYVLSLSWSPTFCLDPIKRLENPVQCNANEKNLWSVHGFWPDSVKGWSKYCPTNHKFNAESKVMHRVAHILPNRSFARYQWYKHGACSGLSQEDYFAQLLRGYNKIKLPDLTAIESDVLHLDVLEKIILRKNPSFNLSQFSVRCMGEKFQEVNFCLSKMLKPVVCHNVSSNCPAEIILPPMQ